MGATKAAPAPKDDQAAKLASLEEKVALLQKYGPLTDEELAAKKVEAARKVRHAADIADRESRRKTEEERARQEIRKIAGEALGKRIILAVNGQRINTLLPDGSVPCPGCGGPCPEATGALMMLAELIRTVPNLRDLLSPVMNPGFGMPRLGAPAIYFGETCKGCRASVEVLAQLVIA